MSTVSARDFNRDVSAAKRDALVSPVIITDRGKPSHVLLSFEEYRRITSKKSNLVDQLRMDDEFDIECEEFPQANLGFKPVEF